MSDLIDRQSAIGAVDVYLKRLCNYIGTPKDTELYALERGLLTSVKIDIGELPSAQLGTNLAEVGTDCISRQAATDVLRKMQTYKLFSGDDMLLIDQAGAQTELMLLPSRTPMQELLDVTADRDYWKAQCHSYEMTINRLTESVQPERKRGKWKTAYLDHVSMGIRPKVLYCSECNQCIAYPTNFCPNCGARMEVTT